MQHHQITTTSSKAKVSHIMLSPYPFLCPCSYLQDNEKESNQSALGIKLPVRNRLLGIPSLIAYLASLSSTHLQLRMCFQKRYHVCLENR
ncbi:hypothetical protein ACFX2F_000465 [Malus domestica]